MSELIDWSQIKELEDDMGAEDLGEVIEIFLSEVESALGPLVDAPPTDAGEMASQMHFLKGCAYNLGFAAFGAICAEGEAKSHGGDLSGVVINDVSALYGASKTEFIRDFSLHSSAVLEPA